MRADDGSRTLAVYIQVANVEFAHGAFNLVARAGVDSARKAKLRVIGNFERVIVISGFDHRQHRSEDFFLLELRLGLDVRNDRRLDEVAVAGTGVAGATGDEPSVLLADLNVVENIFHRAFVDDRSHVGVLGGIPNLDLFHTRLQLVEEFVVNLLVNNCPRAGGALLALESERGSGYPLNRGVE